MKRFRFQLETVLDYKQQVLDGLMVELGTLQERVRRQEEVRDAARARLAEYSAEYEEKKQTGLSIVDALEYQSGQEYLVNRLDREQEELEKRRRQAEAKRQEVVRARQDAFSLEKLKELHRKEYDAAVLKEEERGIDDLTAARRVMAMAGEAAS